MADMGVVKSRKLWLAQYNLSGYLNQIGHAWSCPPLDNTKFGMNTVSHAASLGRIQTEVAGFFDPTADAAINGRIAVEGQPLSVGMETGAEGEVAYTHVATVANYQPGPNTVGQMARFDLSAMGRGTPWVRGTIMHAGTETTTDDGTAYQVGAVSASQSMYAAIHVIAWNATSLDVIVESDDNESFTSGTTRISFTQATALTSEWASVAGAITDDWWRVGWTLVGTSAEFVVVIGIK